MNMSKKSKPGDGTHGQGVKGGGFGARDTSSTPSRGFFRLIRSLLAR
jgi:hypothetical protein